MSDFQVSDGRSFPRLTSAEREEAHALALASLEGGGQRTALAKALLLAEEETRLWKTLVQAMWRVALWPEELSGLDEADFDRAHRDFRDAEDAKSALIAAGIDPDAP